MDYLVSAFWEFPGYLYQGGSSRARRKLHAA